MFFAVFEKQDSSLAVQTDGKVIGGDLVPALEKIRFVKGCMVKVRGKTLGGLDSTEVQEQERRAGAWT